MNEKQAFDHVRKALKPKRYEHTVRVVETADALQKKYGGSRETIRLAAILHDYAKYRQAEEMRQEVRNMDDLPDDLLDYGDDILHAFVGAVYVKRELGVNDEEILNAIRYHTTGRSGMSREEKIVFLADYIEPGRTFKQANETRETAKRDLDEACFEALSNSIRFLAGKRLPIYPDTFKGYNDLYQLIQTEKE
ncbi:bis(5'-nucleosyl)-tetraphosphatase (symmetrical) YqeK [Salisediminibacterium selenitireducens]|uniref:bis(5'-nucleosyl)-tetraphosphatase (symmetrical) n=1 Tax=Bacillus selenitireducens (strain ATCC 700615 / DSM 15326 / MLS10) TaxID=439292 RepID=D6XWC8_BACIE|nr:bis(5'-nucleosyl)-tetraphosphatase (symmetrical) YqeK [Salisediminibacterium selenitireducens]ADH99882.1 metal dependent phosphohydrolase [[Bacillus] selenitireducens MLS10]